MATMLVTGVGDEICYWQLWDVVDQLKILEISNINEKSRQLIDSATNVFNMSPT